MFHITSRLIFQCNRSSSENPEGHKEEYNYVNGYSVVITIYLHQRLCFLRKLFFFHINYETCVEFRGNSDWDWGRISAQNRVQKSPHCNPLLNSYPHKILLFERTCSLSHVQILYFTFDILPFSKMIFI